MADIPASISTTAVLTVGGTYSNTLETVGDRDWVRIDLDPEEYVSVALTGVSLTDPYLRVYDSNGNLVAENDDIILGINTDSRVVFGSEGGGTYYVEAAAYNDAGSGTYQFSATAADAPGPIDALDSGRQRTDTATAITVYFAPNGVSRDGVTSEGWSASEIARFEAALATIAAVTNVTFETVSDTNADFQLVLDTNELVNDPDGGPGLLGYFQYPSGSSSSLGVFNGSGYGWDTNGLQVGGLGYSTIVHEVLHGLGLAHPHDGGTVMQGVTSDFGDYGDFDLNQGIYTTMSYNGGFNGVSGRTNSYGNEAGPMAFDIAAVQALYGANTTYANGTDSYELPDSNSTNNGTAWQAIWDTGGIDEITYSGNRDVTIDLRPATLRYEEGGGGFISAAEGIVGGYTIANGVVIENAIGGSGNDTLIGNDADNELTGNAGNDLLLGGEGNDEVDGNSGADDITATSGTNTIYGSSGFDDISGGTGSDTIYGGSGNDQIDGNGGNDFLFGGRGNDDIDGGANNDQITGGMGADDLTGGGGADTFIFEFISDSYAGVGNRDTITDFQTGIDDIDLSNIDGLSFVSTNGFSNVAGEVRLNEGGGDTVIQVDRDGDGNADMEILIENEVGLTVSDFILI